MLSRLRKTSEMSCVKPFGVVIDGHGGDMNEGVNLEPNHGVLRLPPSHDSSPLNSRTSPKTKLELNWRTYHGGGTGKENRKDVKDTKGKGKRKGRNRVRSFESQAWPRPISETLSTSALPNNLLSSQPKPPPSSTTEPTLTTPQPFTPPPPFSDHAALSTPSKGRGLSPMSGGPGMSPPTTWNGRAAKRQANRAAETALYMRIIEDPLTVDATNDTEDGVQKSSSNNGKEGNGNRRKDDERSREDEEEEVDPMMFPRGSKLPVPRSKIAGEIYGHMKEFQKDKKVDHEEEEKRSEVQGKQMGERDEGNSECVVGRVETAEQRGENLEGKKKGMKVDEKQKQSDKNDLTQLATSDSIHNELEPTVDESLANYVFPAPEPIQQTTASISERAKGELDPQPSLTSDEKTTSSLHSRDRIRIRRQQPAGVLKSFKRGFQTAITSSKVQEDAKTESSGRISPFLFTTSSPEGLEHSIFPAPPPRVSVPPAGEERKGSHGRSLSEGSGAQERLHSTLRSEIGHRKEWTIASTGIGFGLGGDSIASLSRKKAIHRQPKSPQLSTNDIPPKTEQDENFSLSYPGLAVDGSVKPSSPLLTFEDDPFAKGPGRRLGTRSASDVRKNINVVESPMSDLGGKPPRPARSIDRAPGEMAFKRKRSVSESDIPFNKPDFKSPMRSSPPIETAIGAYVAAMSTIEERTEVTSGKGTIRSRGGSLPTATKEDNPPELVPPLPENQPATSRPSEMLAPTKIEPEPSSQSQSQRHWELGDMIPEWEDLDISPLRTTKKKRGSTVETRLSARESGRAHGHRMPRSPSPETGDFRRHTVRPATASSSASVSGNRKGSLQSLEGLPIFVTKTRSSGRCSYSTVPQISFPPPLTRKQSIESVDPRERRESSGQNVGTLWIKQRVEDIERVSSPLSMNSCISDDDLLRPQEEVRDMLMTVLGHDTPSPKLTNTELLEARMSARYRKWAKEGLIKQDLLDMMTPQRAAAIATALNSPPLTPLTPTTTSRTSTPTSVARGRAHCGTLSHLYAHGERSDTPVTGFPTSTPTIRQIRRHHRKDLNLKPRTICSVGPS